MEYNSMYFGFAFLYLLAFGFYSLAWAFSRKSTSLIRTGQAGTRQAITGSCCRHFEDVAVGL